MIKDVLVPLTKLFLIEFIIIIGIISINMITVGFFSVWLIFLLSNFISLGLIFYCSKLDFLLFGIKSFVNGVINGFRQIIIFFLIFLIVVICLFLLYIPTFNYMICIFGENKCTRDQVSLVTYINYTVLPIVAVLIGTLICYCYNGIVRPIFDIKSIDITKREIMRGLYEKNITKDKRIKLLTLNSILNACGINLSWLFMNLFIFALVKLCWTYLSYKYEEISLSEYNYIIIDNNLVFTSILGTYFLIVSSLEFIARILFTIFCSFQLYVKENYNIENFDAINIMDGYDEDDIIIDEHDDAKDVELKEIKDKHDDDRNDDHSIELIPNKKRRLSSSSLEINYLDVEISKKVKLCFLPYFFVGLLYFVSQIGLIYSFVFYDTIIIFVSIGILIFLTLLSSVLSLYYIYIIYKQYKYPESFM